MKRLFYAIPVVALLLTSCVTGKQAVVASGQGTVSKTANPNEAYIQTYYPMAVEQMEKHGIPASITLAQAILEGGAGRSDLVKEANNHFGVKADKRWQGKSYSKWDNGKWCQFRVYRSTRESFEDHSKFLLSNSRYDFLFALDKKDYKGWAHGLKKAGYAEDSQYPKKLIGIIERYGLHVYDSYGKRARGKKQQSEPCTAAAYTAQQQEHGLHKANGLIYIVANYGDTFEGLSSELGISKRKLRTFNDLYKGYVINEGDIIYLERKNSKARRGYKFHTIQPGESIHYISQKYGIRLKKLFKMNPMYKEYTKLRVGDTIRLR